MTVAVAVSGGRDSLLALALLRQQGHAPTAVHAFLAAETTPDVLQGLHENCRTLGVALQIMDLRGPFQELVIAPYVQSYLQGRTPNPCAWCNVRIKFGLLLDAVRNQGFEALATGHYARLEHGMGGPGLWRGSDHAKDQSYFLSLLRPEQLQYAIFPLEGHRKQDVLPELEGMGLMPPLPTESQEVCFIPGDYRDFLTAQFTHHPASGAITLENGRVVGEHNGLWRYTVGQRKGLDIAWSEPLYVLRKDIAANRLVVGERASLHTDGCRLESVNFLVPVRDWPDELLLQARYRQKPQRVSLAAPDTTFSPLRPEDLRLEYFAPSEPAASGQIGVVYATSGQVLAGGTIIS